MILYFNSNLEYKTKPDFVFFCIEIVDIYLFISDRCNKASVVVHYHHYHHHLLLTINTVYIMSGSVSDPTIFSQLFLFLRRKKAPTYDIYAVSARNTPVTDDG